MNKQQRLSKLEELKGEPIIQEIPAKTLEWGKIAEKEMEWDEAKKWCEKQGKGWRLPTMIELLQAYNDCIFGFGTSLYWSSTEDSESDAWDVYFSTGYTTYNNKTNLYSVRCVREIN